MIEGFRWSLFTNLLVFDIHFFFFLEIHFRRITVSMYCKQSPTTLFVIKKRRKRLAVVFVPRNINRQGGRVPGYLSVRLTQCLA